MSKMVLVAIFLFIYSSTPFLTATESNRLLYPQKVLDNDEILEAYNELGIDYFVRGDYSQACSAFQYVIEKKRNDPEHPLFGGG